MNYLFRENSSIEKTEKSRSNLSKDTKADRSYVVTLNSTNSLNSDDNPSGKIFGFQEDEIRDLTQKKIRLYLVFLPYFSQSE